MEPQDDEQLTAEHLAGYVLYLNTRPEPVTRTRDLWGMWFFGAVVGSGLVGWLWYIEATTP